MRGQLCRIFLAQRQEDMRQLSRLVTSANKRIHQNQSRHSRFKKSGVSHVLFPLPPGEGEGEGVKESVKHLYVMRHLEPRRALGHGSAIGDPMGRPD